VSCVFAIDKLKSALLSKESITASSPFIFCCIVSSFTVTQDIIVRETKNENSRYLNGSIMNAYCLYECIKLICFAGMFSLGIKSAISSNNEPQLLPLVNCAGEFF